MAKQKVCKVLALASMLAIARHAHAVNNYTWSAAGANNNWSTPGNWNPVLVPPSVSHVFFAASNQSISANLDTDYLAAAPLDQMNLQATSADSIVFSQSAHTLFISPSAGENYSLSLTSASNSSVTYNLSGGTLSLTGAAPFSINDGIFNLSGSSALLSANSEQFRDSTFTQTGSSHTYSLLGLISSSYFLSAGSLSGSTLALTAGTVTQSGGTHTVSGLASLTTQGSGGAYLLQDGTFSAGTLAVGPGSTLSQTGGTLNAATFSENGGSATFDGPQSLYSIPSFSLSAGTFSLTSSVTKTLVTSTLAVTGTGQFDLTSGNIILRDNPPNTAPLNTLLTAVNKGLIFSSSVTSPSSLAVIKGGDYLALFGAGATFAGQSIGVNDAILTHALIGDANLSGQITISDYSQLDAAFLLGHFDGVTNVASWTDGDFNHDGKIDYQDYALIDAAFANQSGGLASGLIREHIAEFGQSYVTALGMLQSASVPEPASAILLMLASTPFLCRKYAPYKRGKSSELR